MKKLLFVILTFHLFCATAFGQITIDKKDRVANTPPGYCCWCGLEILGRHHNIPALFDLAKKRADESDVKEWNSVTNEFKKLPLVMVKYGDGEWVEEKVNVGSDWSVYRKLTKLGVKFKMQKSGVKDTELISYAMKNKLGLVFAVKEGAFGKFKDGTPSEAHAMVMTHYDQKTIKLIDPNDIDDVYTASREWFDYWWTGFLVVIEKK